MFKGALRCYVKKNDTLIYRFQYWYIKALYILAFLLLLREKFTQILSAAESLNLVKSMIHFLQESYKLDLPWQSLPFIISLFLRSRFSKLRYTFTILQYYNNNLRKMTASVELQKKLKKIKLEFKDRVF